ncbi:hypothetical protein PCASD_13720 [Puccinia coronata f. sp. avenae]|uniref:Uncharacterized protein n=1 Tax=Puccinia coronata f. sp. avenae TaxID=200324 RepID=A0A2N5UF67_9BASI|nr:hypothetical protein PCASD_13720 [Puccinia coronata f. sp. avenae]
MTFDDVEASTRDVSECIGRANAVEAIAASDYCATVRLADTAMMGVKGGGKTVYKYW